MGFLILLFWGFTIQRTTSSKLLFALDRGFCGPAGLIVQPFSPNLLSNMAGGLKEPLCVYFAALFFLASLCDTIHQSYCIYGFLTIFSFFCF